MNVVYFTDAEYAAMVAERSAKKSTSLGTRP
jgi:hypothetical protein